MTTTDLRNKVALVTGASRGIGRAIAERLGRAGALVAITYNVSGHEADEVTRAIETAGGQAFAMQAGLHDGTAVGTLFERMDAELTARTGDIGLDIVVNNAGNLPGGWNTLDSVTPEVFDRTIAIHARAPFFVLQAAAKRLRNGGRIINISSGLSKRPVSQVPVYSMAKAAIDTLTRALAIEFGARGITVNVVAPGWTETDGNADVRADPELVATITSETALGRFGVPADIASVVAFLASPKGGWITGQYIEASGGYRL